jgi:hypothetical protein
MPRWAATLAVASVAVASVGATGCSESGDGGTDAGTATTVAPLAVGEFRSVIVAGAMDVDVTVGPSLTAEVRGTAQDVEQVSAEAAGENLFLRTPDGFRRSGPLTVVLTTPALDQGSVGGAGNLDITGISASRFVAEIAGAGNLTASGSAATLTAVLGGAGNLALDDLVAGDVDVQLVGTGNVSVHADRTLSVNLVGGGNVVYRGDPAVEQTISGSGTVQRAG